MKERSGWIGVDLDGTLAYFDVWQGIQHIGAPIPKMVRRVKRWIAAGRDVRIFTARISHMHDRVDCSRFIRKWCLEHIGRELPITCLKDFDCVAIYDDRAYRIEHNTGRRIK